MNLMTDKLRDDLLTHLEQLAGLTKAVLKDIPVLTDSERRDLNVCASVITAALGDEIPEDAKSNLDLHRESVAMQRDGVNLHVESNENYREIAGKSLKLDERAAKALESIAMWTRRIAHNLDDREQHQFFKVGETFFNINEISHVKFHDDDNPVIHVNFASAARLSFEDKEAKSLRRFFLKNSVELTQSESDSIW